MTARILVVDDNPINRRLLQAKLTGEYYDVLTAASGREALAAVAERAPDLVLLDVVMPDLSGYSVCRQIKADGQCSHIPVVMVTALDSPQDMVEGLECGADDFLTKPVDDLALFARVRSLVRLKRVLDEWRLREGSELGEAGYDALADEPVAGAKVFVMTSSNSVRRTLQQVAATLGHHLEFSSLATSPDKVLADGGYDLILADLGSTQYDALRLCSQARSNEATRHIPFVLIGDRDCRERLFKGLDLGATEYLFRPLNRNEVTARLTTQVRRHRLQQRIVQRHQASIDQAMHDALTGLYNRHYLERHLPRLHARALESGRPLAVIVCDLEHFKRVNDTHGHAAGDAVLRQVGKRLSAVVRTPDFVARFGGEEFIALLSDTSLDDAIAVAERMRASIAGQSIPISSADQTTLAIQTSATFGVSTICWGESGPEAAIRRADAALYRAKELGRNRVGAIGGGVGAGVVEAETAEHTALAQATGTLRRAV
jgi:two-component system cell cycle response regulator